MLVDWRTNLFIGCYTFTFTLTHRHSCKMTNYELFNAFIGADIRVCATNWSTQEKKVDS